MKKLYLLLSILSLFVIQEINASHLLGGEISWECIYAGNDQGKMIFRMRLYRACPGVNLGQSYSISNPLYSANGGAASITVSLVSSASLTMPCYNPSSSIYCYSQSQNGNAIEEKIYESSPVSIYGVPDAAGSDFWMTSCCRPGAILMRNINGSGYYLRSVMFPYKDPNTGQYRSLGSSSTGPNCYDGSPQYAERPAVTVCSKRPNVYDHRAFDMEGDSLHYEWSPPMQSATNPITWRSNYSNSQQLPGTAHNNMNVAPILDPVTGILSFTTHAPIGGYHSICVKSSAYKNGQKVAEIYRDVAIAIINCNDTISVSPLLLNTAPSISYKPSGSGGFQSSYNTVIKAGDSIELDIRVQDLDLLPLIPLKSQSVTLEILGLSMSDRVNDDTSCIVGPCAYLDTTLSTGYVDTLGIFQDTSSLTAHFKWKTSCDQLQKYSIVTGYQNYRVYHFIVRAKDNWCPIQYERSSVFTISVYDSTSHFWPITYLDASQGGASIAWLPYTQSNFSSYELTGTYGWPIPYQSVASINNALQTTYYDAKARTDSASIYYLMRVNPGLGCETGYEVRTIHNSIDSADTNEVSLSWNRPYDNKLYFNSGWYFIYRTDTLGNWHKIDSSSFGKESYTDYYPLRNVYIKYRIESSDPYGLIAISNIDSVFVTDSGSGPPPNGLMENESSVVNVYPNPFQNHLVIDVNESDEIIPFKVYDILGNVKMEGTLNEGRNQLDVGSLIDGVYYFQYVNIKGEINVKRLVKVGD